MGTLYIEAFIVFYMGTNYTVVAVLQYVIMILAPL
jgi:hypothetical protein